MKTCGTCGVRSECQRGAGENDFCLYWVALTGGTYTPVQQKVLEALYSKEEAYRKFAAGRGSLFYKEVADEYIKAIILLKGFYAEKVYLCSKF